MPYPFIFFFNLEENQVGATNYLWASVGAHYQSSESVTQASSSPQLHLAPCALAKEDSCSCGLVVTRSQEVPPRRLCHQMNRKRTFLLQSHQCRLPRQRAPTCRPQPGQGSPTIPPVLRQPSAPPPCFSCLVDMGLLESAGKISHILSGGLSLDSWGTQG